MDDRAQVSLVAFHRLGGYPPPEREMLEVELDGAFRLWRSIAPAVGRFAGQVAEPAEFQRLVEAAAADAPPAGGSVTPDAPIETVVVGDASLRLEAGVAIEGPWGELLDACRRLADDGLRQPIAAIGIELEPPDTVRLVHRGREPLPIELGTAEVQLNLWRDGAPVAIGSTRPKGVDHVEAGPGWSIEIAVPGLAGAGAGLLGGQASFIATDAGVYVPVSATIAAIPIDP
jgi:hypothetical protein